MFKESIENQYLSEQAKQIDFTDEQWKSLLYAESEHELYHQIDESDIPTMYNYGKEVLKGVWSRLRDEIKDTAKQFNVSIQEIKMALTAPSIKEVLKSFGYSIKAFVKGVLQGVGIVGTLCHDLFEELQKYGFADDLDRGIKHIDRFLESHPLAKKVSGFMVATVLVYIWLSMTFTGRFSSDMNLKNIILALSGKYTLSDIFTTSEGKMMLALFGTGSFVTFPWLGITAGNLLLAMVYTGFMLMNEHQIAQKIGKRIKTGQKIRLKR